MLKTITISNFKSVLNEPVSLGNFNALIGANAAGKSNFVDALKFIYDVLNNGVSRAIGRRFGWENVLTREKFRSEKITTKIFYDLEQLGQEIKVEKRTYKPLDFKYEFEVGYAKKQFFVYSEILNARFEHNGKQITEAFERSLERVKIESSIGLIKHPKPLIVPRQLKEKLFLQGGFFCLGSIILSHLIDDWRFYNLDVNVARNPCVDKSQDVLQGDGENLAAILDRLRDRSSREVRQRILRVMSIFIPGFERWETETQFDGSLGFKIREKGITKGLLPKMVSDGTIRLLSILLALLYQPSQAELICIDEPERYLHPQALKPLVEIMRDVSKRTQLIVTTHSAELVKWLKPSEVLMVDKIKNVTHIARAQDVSMVDKFLEELSLDELWLAGYLNGGKIV